MKTAIKTQFTTTKPRRRSVDWPVFQSKLAQTLGYLTEDEFLILSRKHSSRFVQFSAQGSFGTRIETTSNAYLGEEEQIGSEAHRVLLSMGWKAPTGNPAESTPGDDPDGSPNYFVDFPQGTSCENIAMLAIRTLADIFGVSHPGQLEYESFDSDGNRIEHPSLGVKSSPLQKKPSGPAEQLAEAIRTTTGIHDLDYDDDGFLKLSFGNIEIFICLVSGGAPYVRILSPLLTQVQVTEGLLAQLNTLNAQANHLCFFANEENIMAMADIPACTLVAGNVELALNHFSKAASEAANLLRAFVGGSTLIVDPAMSSSLQ